MPTGLLDMKMYMKVAGVTGDVIKPPAFMGWIPAQRLRWPGATPSNPPSGSIDNTPKPTGKGEVWGFPDFPSKQLGGGDFQVISSQGKHSPYLARIAAMSQDEGIDVDIWAPLDHNKIVKAAFKRVMIVSYDAKSSTTGESMEMITFNAGSGKMRIA
jgi:hypothetical protein